MTVILEVFLRWCLVTSVPVGIEQNGGKFFPFSISLLSIDANGKFAQELWMQVMPQVFFLYCGQESLVRSLICFLSGLQSCTVDNSERVERLLDSFRIGKVILPPHLISFVARTHSVWYPSLCYLENADDEHSTTVQDDALPLLYRLMGHEDYYIGRNRRKAAFPETLTALSLAALHHWPQTQNALETVQAKARNLGLPFSEQEYALWEREW